MFSKWREFLTFTAFPPLKRPNSEPELNSPNFEAFSDDEEWILVREKSMSLNIIFVFKYDQNILILILFINIITTHQKKMLWMIHLLD